jgi:hypothetical protein
MDSFEVTSGMVAETESPIEEDAQLKKEVFVEAERNGYTGRGEELGVEVVPEKPLDLVASWVSQMVHDTVAQQDPPTDLVDCRKHLVIDPLCGVEEGGLLVGIVDLMEMMALSDVVEVSGDLLSSSDAEEEEEEGRSVEDSHAEEDTAVEDRTVYEGMGEGSQVGLPGIDVVDVTQDGMAVPISEEDRVAGHGSVEEMGHEAREVRDYQTFDGKMVGHVDLDYHFAVVGPVVDEMQ